MILVTGGTGLVGAHLLLRLVERGDAPRAIYRTEKRIAKVKKVFSYYVNDYEDLFKKIEWVQGDINDLGALEDAFKDIEYVYHAAALISFDPSDFKKLHKTNVQGTANVVNFCISRQIKKLCYVSSIAAVGQSIGDEKVTESTPWNDATTNGYALTKHAAELEVWRASQEGIPIVVVNPGVIMGPGYWWSGSGKFFWAAYKEPKYYLPSGTGFCTVDDVTNSMLSLMDAEIQNERFIVVSETRSYQNIAQVLAKALKKKVPNNVIKPWMLALFWRFDWLKSSLTGSKRKLSKSTAEMFKKTEHYDNSKIQNCLPNYAYDNLDNKIKAYCAIFLQEQNP
ncbi:NAD-dependent epimerase/dehydratase family protein [uncultured Croceitalea sp.]|uniref:NAD-dependent epimerase/dehydratase family protein n=1 Tax=uncultured Croceitalea sp. TaxID=1798908 RepID=UPI0033067D43